MAITKVTNAVLSSGANLDMLTGKSFLHETNMASNSATGIASQQSIKAYVDSQSGSTTLLGLTDVGSDGTNGQVLTTNGSGGFTFTTVSGGSSTPSIDDQGTGTTALTIYSSGQSAFAADVQVTGSIYVSGTVDGVDIAARNTVLTSTTTTANAALPKAGGTMTGNLTVNAIVTATNTNMDLDPNGSGVVVFKGNTTKGAGQFKLNCENNSHGITIKGPPHSAGASYTLTLPNDDGSSNQVLTTNGSGVLSWSTPSSGSSYDDAAVNTHLNTSTASTNEVLSWNGSDYDWVAQSSGGSVNGLFATDIFTATSGQTAFTLSNSVSNENNLMVFVDGVFQAQNTYSTSGTTLTFATGIVLNRVVTVYHIETASGGGGGGSSYLSGGTKISLAASQSGIARNTTTKVTFDTVEFGNSGTPFSTTNNNYTVPSAGKYLIVGQTALNNYNLSSGGMVSFSNSIYKNGSSVQTTQYYYSAISNGAIRQAMPYHTVLDLAQNDVIDFRVSVNTYVTTATLSVWNYNQMTYVYIVRVE